MKHLDIICNNFNIQRHEIDKLLKIPKQTYEFKCTLLLKPLTKQRHRFTLAGLIYDPAGMNKRNYKKLLKQKLPSELTEIIKVKRIRKYSLSFKFTEQPDVTNADYIQKIVQKTHTQKPDIDNLAKFFMDTANGLLYNDDCKITNLHASKEFGFVNKIDIKIKIIYER